MALRTIRTDEDPILRKKSREIKEIDDRIKTLLDDMQETMYHAEGVGLAAPQVGVLRRAIVVDVGEGLIQMINPEILTEEGSVAGEEACLSVPMKKGRVERPQKITVRYRNIDNEEINLEASEFLARAICHEIDHLDGILYTDRATKMYRIVNEEDDDK